MSDLVGAVTDSSGQAANKLSAGYNSALTNVSNIQNQNVANVTSNEQPYTAVGTTAANALNTGEQAGGYFTQNFTLADLQTDPGYQFDLQQGNQAVSRAAAASGTLNSGGTLKALDQYTTGLASQEINNAYTRYTTDQTNQFNRLYQLAGLGQTATGQINQADTNQANVVSNATQQDITGSAAAQASGIIGETNAIGGTLSQAASGISTLSAMNALPGVSSVGLNMYDNSAYALNNAGYGNTAYDMLDGQ